MTLWERWANSRRYRIWTACSVSVFP